MFNPHIDNFFLYELPEDFVMNEGEYFSFMDETYDGIVQKFHSALGSKLKPNRRDVKQMLANLIKFIEVFVANVRNRN